MNQSNMHAAGTITNEMLYELLKEFKVDVNRRFEQMQNDMDRQFTEIRQLIKEDKQKLEKVYEARHKVSVDFTRSWIMGSFFIALFASTIVLAVAKAF